RHCPVRLKFSNANPKGSNITWQFRQAGLLRCSSMRARIGLGRLSSVLTAGTLGGGSGGPIPRNIVNSIFPLWTGDVLLFAELTVRKLPCPSIPARRLSANVIR